MAKRRRVFAGFVLAGVLGCGSAGSDPTAGVVRFVPGPCAVELPAGQDPADVTCGTVTVPEQRQGFDGRTLELAVVVLRATGDDPAPDPVVFLSGGPGDSALGGALRNWTAEFAAPLQSRRDLVFFDQRGTGYSRPLLGCPEYVQATRDQLAEDLNASEDGRRGVAALLACRERLLAEGVRLDAYSSTATAADVGDLMHALGYASWNLRGISYGARVALTALRDAPDGVRSVILDSPVPPQVNFQADFGSSFGRALDVLFERCADDAACSRAYPDLRGTLATLVARLDESPLVLAPVDSGSGQQLPLVVNGDRLLLGLQQALYSSELIPVLPFAIARVAAGETFLLEQLAADVTVRNGFVAWGQHYSVFCAEETPFLTADVLEDAARGAAPRLFAIGLGLNVEPSREVCASWGVPAPAAIENEVVRSRVPGLVLSGEHDPVSPPGYAAATASGLETAYVFELPGYGHGVLPRRGPEGDRPGCAQGIIAQFLDAPQTPPDASCIAQIPPVRFVGA